MRRLLDIALSGAALVTTAPLLAVLAAAIKLDSRGPALYIQTRVGRHQRPFKLVKLRTMRVDSAPGAHVTHAGDSRITRVGALLRRAKLDELPQLWNVICGDMSIVGPRPEVPRYVERYRPEWQRLFSVRPGLTDVASLAFRHEERLLGLAHDRERAYTEVVMPLKLQLALSGLERSSVLDDLTVMVRTALAIVGRADPNPAVREAEQRIEQLNRESR